MVSQKVLARIRAQGRAGAKAIAGQQAVGSGTAESSPFWKNRHWSPSCMLATRGVHAAQDHVGSLGSWAVACLRRRRMVGRLGGGRRCPHVKEVGTVKG